MIRNLISKYRNAPLPVKAAAWFVVCSAVQNGSRFLSMPIILRMITPDEYGMYSVFFSWINVFSVFAHLCMDSSALNNAMLKYPDKRDRYISSVQGVSILFTLAWFTVYLIFRDAFNALFGLPTELSVMIFVQLLFTEGFLMWLSRQRYEYVYKKLVIAICIFSFSYLAIPIICGYVTPPENRLFAIVCGGVAVQSAFGLGFVIYNYIKGKCFFDKEYWKFVIGFGIPLIPYFLSNIVLCEADRVMIKSMIGDAEAGIYSFVYTISIVVNIVIDAVNSALIPMTYNILKSRDGFNVLRSAVNFMMIALSVMILMFACIAPEFIKIFATEAYYEAIYLVPIISVGTLFNFLFYIFVNVETYFESTHTIAAAALVGALVNIGLNWVLIPIFGYFAAGYTTLICYILYSVMHFIFMKKLLKKNIGGKSVYDHKTIFAVSAAVLAAAFLLLLVYDLLIVRYLILVAAIILSVLNRKKIMKYFNLLKENFMS